MPFKKKAPVFFLAAFLLSMNVLGEEASPEQLIAEILDLSKTPSERIEKHYTPGTWLLRQPRWFEKHPIYGFKHTPNTQVRSILRHQNEIIWDKTYHSDEFGNRALPANLQGPAHGPRMTLMGCSLIVGPGLNDDETIMANLARLNPDYQVRTLASIGSGPHMTLAQLEHESEHYIRSDIEDIYIYNFSEAEHLGRANGLMLELGWLEDTPYYEKTTIAGQERVVSEGNFIEARPLTTKALNFLRTHFFKNATDIEVPPIWDIHREKVCLIFAEMKQVITAHNPKARFFVYHYLFNRNIPPYYAECFKKHNISYILPETQWGINGDTIYPHDFHPTPKGAKMMAESIQQNLSAYGVLKQSAQVKK